MKQSRAKGHFQEVTIPIRVVCAWCGKPMGTKTGIADLAVSHSICPACAEKVRAELDNNSKNAAPARQATNRPDANHLLFPGSEPANNAKC